jgi:hypothetical protein
MAYLYLAESAESTLPSQSGFFRSPIVKSSPTLKRFYCHGCKVPRFIWPQSGMTCEHCGAQICQESISFTADSPAKTSHLPALEQAWLESEADFISKSKGLSAKQNQLSSSLKTSLRSGHADLDVWCGDFPSSGMIVDGQLYQPLKLVPRTSAKDGSYLPTPRANDAEKRGNFDANNPRNGLPGAIRLLWPTPTAQDYGSNQGGGAGRVGEKRPSLNTIARMWPTPKASEATRGASPAEARRKSPSLSSIAVGLWSTPNARDHKDRHSPKRHGQHSPSIAVQVSETGHPGYLNPRFIEAIMGYSTGWSELTDWATQWFRSKRAKRSSVSRESGVSA